MDPTTSPDGSPAGLELPVEGGTTWLILVSPLVERWKSVVLVPLLAGLAALGVTYLIAPTFTARTTFLPPQQQQSTAATALASLSALSGLAGAAASIRTPADQYVSLMQSSTVQDRLIDEFKLREVYDVEHRVDARTELQRNVRIAVGKKDGLVTVEVDDKSPERAAALANRHVDELRRLTLQLALTEAQQRRAFFEGQLKLTRDKLVEAQVALQGSGFNAGALRAEPKAAAESYARLRAEATSAEVRLQSLRRSLADATPEVQQQQSILEALRSQLRMIEANTERSGGPDYIGKYREFKYQETLFELLARQYEFARVDESKEGALFQVVDPATPPEKRSSPKRALVAVATTLAALVAMAGWLLMRDSWQRAMEDPLNARVIERVRAARRREKR